MNESIDVGVTKTNFRVNSLYVPIRLPKEGKRILIDFTQ